MKVEAIEHAPHLGLVRTVDGEMVIIDARDDRRYKVKDYEELRQLVADLSATDEHLPIGSAVHSVLSFLGIPRCGACAERQARLNRWVRRWRLWSEWGGGK